VTEDRAICPECGTVLSGEVWSPGLCPRCSLLLALDVDHEPTGGLVDSKIDSSSAQTADFPALVATDDPTLGFTPPAAAIAQPPVDSPPDSTARGTAGVPLSSGRVLGDRYRIRSRLGRGGMGEVWRAFDLKLRVDVALKALRDELAADQQALEALRSEVRLAREVISPNACRVYDLEELEGQELVSMEYIDGTTLLDVIQNRGPLDLSEAREIASQFLAGLEAVHEAGLVHRDMKPENVMLTRAGRVVVMDFGIAKSVSEGKGGLIAGTPAYMAPEQSQGEELDARADVFAAGVILAEMTAPSGVVAFKSRQTIWQGIHQPQPVVPETPWSKILTKAVAPNREDRYPGAWALARALEEIALRVEGAEELHPYPGLSAFSQDDAKYFFGRELEIESMWKKLRRPHLLGLIGPSGAGKSSFVQAGLLPVMPEGWRAIVTTPGNRPFQALAQALAEESEDDPEALEPLLEIEQPEVAVEVAIRWRGRHEQALLVLDQFEELFTQNPPEVQTAFSELLARLALDADIHVLLSMRDDFLFHCSDQPALAPVFSELTPLRAPTGASLRRAVVQPALKCGYRFEDEALVEEILFEVEGERGALPLLAFACSRLWEQRDRDLGLLTREAYEAIGGVAGSLAHHAEATLERIGSELVPFVRELFRNLVTAQGTRLSRSRDELLSVFQVSAEASVFRSAAQESAGDAKTDARGRLGHNRPSHDAAMVLDTLIDARLLTSYEVSGSDGEAGETRVEIVHESLLSNWPRLVRWRTQDAEGAQLRDELRQAAELWDKRGKPEDLLWTGTSFKEYELWRERYGGGLTSGEEHFAAAMQAKAHRRKRQRRFALTGAFVVLLLVLAVVGGLWRRSEREGQRAEANQLLALGRLEVESNPTGALAYALASLERSDDPVTRLFALEVVSENTIGWVLQGTAVAPAPAYSIDFSADGKWLASGHPNGEIRLWSSTGGTPRSLATQEADVRNLSFIGSSNLLVSSSAQPPVAHVWRAPKGELLRTIESDDPFDIRVVDNVQKLLTTTRSGDRTRVEVRSALEGEPRTLGYLGGHFYRWALWPYSWNFNIDSTGSMLALVPFVGPEGELHAGSEVHLVHLLEDSIGPAALVGRHAELVSRVSFQPGARRLAAADESGEVRIWNIDDSSETPERTLHHPRGWVRNLRFDGQGSRLAAASWSGHAAVWDLQGPSEAEPEILRSGASPRVFDARFDPHGDWLATASEMGMMVWPANRRRPLELTGHEKEIWGLEFLPGGAWLATAASDTTLRLWPMYSNLGSHRVLFDKENDWLSGLAVGPSGGRILVKSATGLLFLVPTDGTAPRRLEDFGHPAQSLVLGSRIAVASSVPDFGLPVVRIWDLVSGGYQELETGAYIADLELLDDERLITAGGDGIRIWSVADGTSETVSDKGGLLGAGRDAELVTAEGRGDGLLDLSADGRLLLAAGQGNQGEAVLYDLVAGTSRQLDAFGSTVAGALEPNGQAVALLGTDGWLRVGQASGDSVHLLGGQDSLRELDFSPDGQWIATLLGEGSTKIRLWPVPDLKQPPMFRLPRAELLQELRSRTNLRVVKDPGSTSGWSFELEPFPGWDEVNSW